MIHECDTKREPVERTVRLIAEFCDALSMPKGELADQAVNYLWMDSRKIETGDLFVALKGEQVDGHDYVETALNAGAVAAIVAEEEAGRYSEEIAEKLIVVKDPLTAIQVGAREYRRMLNIPFVAVTGSNGKTSTSHFLKEILSTAFNVGTTHGNFNNHIGLPLSIFRFDGMEDIAVLEMGANHPGEIAELTAIAEPDMGVITNVGYAHVGEFGGIENTASAKFELAEAIKNIGGLLYLNGDDKISVEKNMEMEIPAFYFGTRDHNSVKAENVTCSDEGCYSFDLNGVRYELQIPGKHFMYNLLPALAIAIRLNVIPEELQAKVKEIRPANLRGTIREINGVRYIEDCYNANPSSMKVATELLRDIPTEVNRIAVAGDMLELGDYSHDLHKECGEYFGECGVDAVIAVGKETEAVLSGAVSGGIRSENCYAADSIEAAAKHIKAVVKAGDLVLLKGSRGVGLERVFPLLEENA